MQTERSEVYRVINGERSYQNAKWPGGDSHSVGEHLIMLRTYLREAEENWTRHSGDAKALESIRKIAGIAVRCMENHGAIPRYVE